MVGLVIGLPVLLLVHDSDIGRSLEVSAVAGFGLGFSLLLVYSSMRFLFVGVSSALSAVVACIIPIAYEAARRQPVSLREFLGVAVCAVALLAVARWRGDSSILEARPRGAASECATKTPARWQRHRGDLIGIVAALSSGGAMSIYYIALAGTSPGVQAVEAIESRFLASVILYSLAISLQRRNAIPERAMLASAVPVGLFGVIGALAYAIAVRSGNVGVIVPIVSLSPCVTISVAWFSLHEKISRRQLGGIALAMIGLVIITA